MTRRHLSSGLFAVLAALVAAGCTDRLPTAPSADAGIDPGQLHPSAALSAESFDGNIRIGVVPSATKIRIGASGEFTLVNKATGATIFIGSDGEVVAELLTAGEVDERFWLQTACAGEAARDDWLSRAHALGHETRTEFVPHVPCWRLQLGTMNQGWGDRVAFREQAIADGLAGGDSFWTLVTIILEEPQVQVTFEGGERIVDAAVVLESAGELVTIEGIPYRGVAEIWTNSAGTLAGINELPLEQYLYGVVPRELPPTVWHQLEAQKAQAIAARTFALSRIGHRAADGYDLLPTTADQVYGGYGSEHPLSNQAVDATAGIVATHDGSLITTVYHSTSGGFTANNEDVWQSGPVAYLRGVPDAERGRALEKNPNPNVFRNASGGRSLRGFRGGDYEADWSQYHRWHFEWTADEISGVISEFAGTDVGAVHEINVLSRSESGRVYEIEFVTERGTFTEAKDRIRWALQFINAAGNHSPLLSTLFLVEPILDDASGQVKGFQAWGGGWGHGIGMSQTGAAGMAERGRSFDEILKHYYTGIELETWTF